MIVALVVPALDEEASVGGVVRDFLGPALDEIVVCDNGSSDGTARVARAAGATVVTAPRRGYGSACLAGLAYLARRPAGPPDVVAFADADRSDHAGELALLLAPLARGEADLVVGSRALGKVEAGSMTAAQRFGNRLASVLIRALHGARVTDLGPFRAVRWDALERLAMRDRDYGWTVEMQLRAIRLGMRVVEVPVSYRRRVGRSKISGTVRGVIGAGVKIVGTILLETVRPLPRAVPERKGGSDEEAPARSSVHVRPDDGGDRRR